MVLMAIDHTRDFVNTEAMQFQPENLARTTPAIFLTRWITHFCAPVFMFCAGLGIWFRQTRRGDDAGMSWFLVTRGLWLILLEVTAVRVAFFFNVGINPLFLLVFWALGWSMIALAAAIHLPWRVLLVSSLLLVALHNLADGVRAATMGSWAWLWRVLHEPGPISLDPLVFAAYPLIPWIAVMALGYCAGRIYDLDAGRRRRLLIGLGLAMTGAFILLRAANVYGDPRPFAIQSSPAFTLLSFLNTTKYPPSLLFLLMTLGPALIFLGTIDGIRPSSHHPLLIFGRVPLFYFVLHLFVIHAVAIGMTAVRYGNVPFLFTPPPRRLRLEPGGDISRHRRRRRRHVPALPLVRRAQSEAACVVAQLPVGTLTSRPDSRRTSATVPRSGIQTAAEARAVRLRPPSASSTIVAPR
jgi:uncharacterized membrane protein